MVAREADRSVPRYSLIRGVFFTSKELFPNAALKKLILPLVIEQVLAITVGLADTMMVSSVGEAAVSGVSLVDMLNVLIINIFSALATGGAVVVAQLLGARKNDRACDASKQLYLVVTVIALIISTLVMLFRAPLLRLLFGTIEDDVMQSALTYLTVSVFSYPVLAIYNAGAALFRAQGNSRISMLIAGLINIVNLIGNSLFIFVFKWGVGGAALSSVLSRGTAAVAITILLLNPEHTVSLRRGQRFRPDKELIRRILQIGVPNGLENSLFQLGRVLVVSMISLFGTTQITANALANNLDAVAVIPGQAMSLAMITVIGQCIGSGDEPQTRRMAKKLMMITYAVTAVSYTHLLAVLRLGGRSLHALGRHSRAVTRHRTAEQVVAGHAVIIRRTHNKRQTGFAQSVLIVAEKRLRNAEVARCRSLTYFLFPSQKRKRARKITHSNILRLRCAAEGTTIKYIFILYSLYYRL